MVRVGNQINPPQNLQNQGATFAEQLTRDSDLMLEVARNSIAMSGAVTASPAEAFALPAPSDNVRKYRETQGWGRSWANWWGQGRESEQRDRLATLARASTGVALPAILEERADQLSREESSYIDRALVSNLADQLRTTALRQQTELEARSRELETHGISSLTLAAKLLVNAEFHRALDTDIWATHALQQTQAAIQRLTDARSNTDYAASPAALAAIDGGIAALTDLTKVLPCLQSIQTFLSAPQPAAAQAQTERARIDQVRGTLEVPDSYGSRILTQLSGTWDAAVRLLVFRDTIMVEDSAHPWNLHTAQQRFHQVTQERQHLDAQASQHDPRIFCIMRRLFETHAEAVQDTLRQRRQANVAQMLGHNPTTEEEQNAIIANLLADAAVWPEGSPERRDIEEQAAIFQAKATYGRAQSDIQAALRSGDAVQQQDTWNSVAALLKDQAAGLHRVARSREILQGGLARLWTACREEALWSKDVAAVAQIAADLPDARQQIGAGAEGHLARFEAEELQWARYFADVWSRIGNKTVSELMPLNAELQVRFHTWRSEHAGQRAMENRWLDFCNDFTQMILKRTAPASGALR